MGLLLLLLLLLLLPTTTTTTTTYYYYYYFYYQATRFCTPEMIEIILPHLKNELRETQSPSKVIFITRALGNLGRPEVLDMLVPVIRGEKVTEKQVRATATFALTRLARTTPHPHVIRVIKDLLMPIFSSPEEPTQVRIAAFTTLMCARPR